MTWTEERTNRLRELWPDPLLSAALIAIEIGVSRNAVLGKAHRLGLGPKPSHHPQTAKVRRTPRIPKPRSPKPKRNFGGVWSNYPRPEPEPFVPRLIEAAPSLAKSILSLRDNDCRFATHEDAETGEYRFCAHPRANGKPYCEAHCLLAYKQPKERSEKQKANDAKMRLYAVRRQAESTKWMAEEMA